MFEGRNNGEGVVQRGTNLLTVDPRLGQTKEVKVNLSTASQRKGTQKRKSNKENLDKKEKGQKIRRRGSCGMSWRRKS